DFQGRVLCSSSISLSKKIDVEIAHRMIVETVNSLCSKSKISVNDIGGIGLADPGFVDIKRGISLNASNIDGWINLQTKKWLAKEFGCKYNTVYPGAMTMAFYEYSKLCNQNKKSLFLLEFGVGIGGAFMKGGEIFKGDQNTGMEIGHIVIDPNGPICNCGNRGCLEAIAGSTGVRRRVNELLKSGVFIPIKSDETLISDFVKSVANGNKAASTLAYEISEKIGDSLASVVAILNPSTIIMSGELAGMGDILLSTVKKCIALKCFPAAVEKLDVRIAPEEEYSGSKGVVNILRNKILRDIFV
ncbi:MAG: ROK family protein, partial [Verrucomicrobiota bacterium]|nr:ROK family protein [Verrucomicrobiota bacterium]